MKTCWLLSFAGCLPATLVAQEGAAGADAQREIAEVVTEQRVGEMVRWLASDERQGRDSPSAGLEAAGEYIEKRFAAAGLEQLYDDSWRHHYTLPGTRIDSKAIEMTVWATAGEESVEKALEADKDVRLLRIGGMRKGTHQKVTVALADDPRMQQLLRSGGGRRPTLLEVDVDNPLWIACEGERDILARRMRASGPVFLVRRGAMPGAGAAGRPSFTATWAVDGVAEVDVPLTNVVGLLQGRTLPDEFVVVSAHYDHVGTGQPRDGDAIYNGADDNATGTTAVVLLAEALATLPRPKRSVVFVCFSAEEKGLRGSAAFCEDPPFALEQVVANVNIEMIGRPPPEGPRTAWVTGRGYSDFEAIAEPAFQRAGIELVEFRMADALFRASDNFPFVRHGVVAHSISAGSLHDDYHKPSDEADLLDIPHMTAVIRGLGEVVLEFANRPERPAYNDSGRRMLDGLRRR
ncbi:MAG: M20/M25/M40 family metallo-hydrolase [Planctomycetota bacterium]|nr:M20/M25/M40 family metallo-hydrolase [Planctomycetota bacterium]